LLSDVDLQRLLSALMAVVSGVDGEGPNRLHGVQLGDARREGCVDNKWPLGLPVGYVVVAVPRSVVRKVELLT